MDYYDRAQAINWFSTWLAIVGVGVSSEIVSIGCGLVMLANVIRLESGA